MAFRFSCSLRYLIIEIIFFYIKPLFFDYFIETIFWLILDSSVNSNTNISKTSLRSNSAISSNTSARTAKQLTNCLDHSKYCGLVHHFKMCGKEKYKIQCCKSCVSKSWKNDGIRNTVSTTTTTTKEWENVKNCTSEKKCIGSKYPFTWKTMLLCEHLQTTYTEKTDMSSSISFYSTHNKTTILSGINDSCLDGNNITTMAVI